MISVGAGLSFEVSASTTEAQLLPVGEFSARRADEPGGGIALKVSEARGQYLAQRITTIAKQTPIVVDYDFQTLSAQTSGARAPAAGWITAARWAPEVGLFAAVDWTEPARSRIAAGEYRFISPVVVSNDTTGEVEDVLFAALVNFQPVRESLPVSAAALGGLSGGQPALPVAASAESLLSDVRRLASMKRLLNFAATGGADGA